jgi:hypothetical protein
VIGALEDTEDYKAIGAVIAADYNAQLAVERELVLRLASLVSRLLRAATMETRLFEIQADHLREFGRARNVQSEQGTIVAMLEAVQRAGSGPSRRRNDDKLWGRKLRAQAENSPAAFCVWETCPPIRWIGSVAVRQRFAPSRTDPVCPPRIGSTQTPGQGARRQAATSGNETRRRVLNISTGPNP